MNERLIVSTSPHIHKKETISWIMWMVILALAPAAIAATFTFGLYSLQLITISILSAVITESVIIVLRRRRITIFDGSAVLTGLLVAYNLPPQVPPWIPAVGSFFAIAIAKQAFGGLGRNIFNPALAARAFLLISWPKYMTQFTAPFSQADSVTSATPLYLLKESNMSLPEMGLSYLDLFLGNRAGCIGCLLYTSPSPRDLSTSRMPSSA